MISLKSVYHYCFTNGIIIAFAGLHYSQPYLFLYLIARNFALIYLIDYMTMGRILYTSPTGIYELYTVQSASLEYMALSLLPPLHESSAITVITFIPMSFVFEILYDFFYFWVHFSFHLTRCSWHKDHHEHVDLMPLVAFHHHPLDEILSKIVPFLLTQRIVHVFYRMSALEIALLATYKVYIEITGHISCSSKRTCSFPQCIWLPRALGIELYADDHAMHHRQTGCNFGKRFTLWDRVFETYRPHESTDTPPSS